MDGPAKKPDFYYTSARPEMLAFVPATVGRALDVGCASGDFGELLEAERGARVWGIEIEPDVAARAARRLERVIVADAIAGLRSLAGETFDLIVFNDVLEHLVEPEQALIEARRLLAPGGSVIASIPHIRFFYALWEIVVEKDLRYREEGTFDRTHLRFFTEKSIRRLFAETGYTIEEMRGINPRGGRKLALLQWLTLGRHSDMRFLQFGVRARPAPDFAPRAL